MLSVAKAPRADARAVRRTAAPTAKPDGPAAATPVQGARFGVLQRKCACGGSCPRCSGESHGGTTLAVNEPGDAFEQEADRIADRVMRMADPRPNASHAPPGVQRKCAACETEEEKSKLRTKRGDAGAGPATAPPIVHEVLRSPGEPLDAATRAFMEPRFGQDLGNVRVHTDAKAVESARAVNALAYTVGKHLVFAEGRYSPSTTSGHELVAHELAHVVQQGGVRSAPASAAKPSQVAAAPWQLMRAADGEGPTEDAGDAQTIPRRGAPGMGLEFDFPPNDPKCSDAPRGLGKITPEIDCPKTSEDIGLLGHHFHFCLGSDVFALPATPTEVLKFVRKQPAKSTFKVHGFASVDGNFDDNMRLSCHRAIRVAREMMNAGVPSESIEIARRGETEEFPGGPEFNRVVVVQPIPPSDATPSGPNLPVSTRKEKEAIVERARRILREGNYRLGADAYLSFWTCGKIKSVSDAVDRMHVRFEGEPGLAKPGTEGIAEGLGTNVIAISDAVLGAANQIDCVIERLVDMAFHHMTLETVPTFKLRHRGSRFLIGLAGLDTCSIPGFSDPIPDDDPLGLLEAPACAEAPLPTRLTPPPKDKKRIPPTFEADPRLDLVGAYPVANRLQQKPRPDRCSGPAHHRTGRCHGDGRPGGDWAIRDRVHADHYGGPDDRALRVRPSARAPRTDPDPRPRPATFHRAVVCLGAQRYTGRCRRSLDLHVQRHRDRGAAGLRGRGKRERAPDWKCHRHHDAAHPFRELACCEAP
jgi:outer membrane protein OmpA-like peptidoglycan-associated protein